MKKNKIIPLVLALLFIPALAAAHVGMLNSTPAENGIVSSPPERITLKFGGKMEPAFSRIEVFDQDGNKMPGKKEFLKGNMIMEFVLEDTLEPGVYTVKWKCMSMDGHTLTEEYIFTIE